MPAGPVRGLMGPTPEKGVGMTTQTNTDPEVAPVEPPTADERIDGRLARIETELRKVGESTRHTNTAYGIFAGLAVLLAGATLVLVATKLSEQSGTRAVTAAAPPAAAAPATPVHATNVTLREFTVAPAPSQVAAGKTTFTVHNGGQVKHEFVVVRTDKAAGSLLKGAEADETGNVGEVPDLPPGSTKTLSLNLKAGHYALICNLPGHYKAGQHADLTVR
jgi:uncharacterized cupredoxin-like copper-binding protein